MSRPSTIPQHAGQAMVSRSIALLLILNLGVPIALPLAHAREVSKFSFHKRDGELEILNDGRRFATYVWSDPVTTRPYFKQVFARDGKTQITRPHPPSAQDFDDHGTFHPGIWWGFGDVGGNDYWRLKHKIVGGDFVGLPVSTGDRAEFTVRNRLLDKDDKPFCLQTCRYQFFNQSQGILIVCESSLLREQDDFWLGDQEEMGLAVRVAKPITQKSGGEIRDSQGRTDRKSLRNQQADWCDYSGTIAGMHGGIMLMNDPNNFRKPWWHNVDTGLLVANPLGQSELSGNGKKRQNIRVPKNKPFRLRYGVLVHLQEHKAEFNGSQAYASFLEVLD